MVVFFLVIAVMLLLLLLRLAFPSDFRVNKMYLGKFLKGNDGKGPKTISSNKLTVVLPPGSPEERVYYGVEAQFADGQQQEVLLQVFYPLEVYHLEREKNERALNTEEMNPNSMTSMGSPSSSSDMEKYREDPFKDLSEEERTRQAKEAELAAEVKQLKLLGLSNTVYPAVIAFDPKQHVTIAEGIGQERLDDYLSRISLDEKEEILSSLVKDLARFHNLGDAVALQLLPGQKHSEAMVSSQIISSFEAWGSLGVSFSPEEQYGLRAAIVPLFSGIEDHMGPKVGDCAPRSFFVRNGRAKSPEWGRARRDVSAIDIIELVCDPVVELSTDVEKRLFELYVGERTLDEEEKMALRKMLNRLAIYYRIALLSYLGQYFRALKSMSPQKRKGFEVKYWSAEALPKAIDNLNVYISEDEELNDLGELLKDKLTALRSS